MLSTTKHIASYVNRRGDIEASVTLTNAGTYAVRVHDVEVEETLPAMLVFTTEDAARAYALQCVTAEDDIDLPF